MGEVPTVYSPIRTPGSVGVGTANGLFLLPDKILKKKVKQITRRRQKTNLSGVIRRLNPVIRGFENYFRIADCRREFKGLMRWIRRRLRSIQLCLWKTPARLHRRLKKLGHKLPYRYIRMCSWRNTASPLAHKSMRNSWFEGKRLFNLEKLDTGVLAPKF